MKTNYIIYGRAPGEKKFKALGDKGQVGNLIRAIVYWNVTPERLTQLTEQIAHMTIDNPEWTFEIRATE